MEFWGVIYLTFPTENKLSAKRNACYCCKGTGVAANTKIILKVIGWTGNP